MHDFLPKLIITLGLALSAAGFTMLDRGCMQDTMPAFGPIDHPAAAITAATGIVLIFGGNLLRKRTPPPEP